MIFWLLLCISISYALLIVSLSYGFTKIPNTSQHNYADVETIFSVIIPFRNEAEKLPKLLTSISQLHYSKDRVFFWFINDASEDDSVAIIEKFYKENPAWNITILQNKRTSASPKKDAITTAISQIQSEWIVTTDADCILPSFWLNALHQKILKEQPEMIAAPVTYVEETSFFSYFQLLDFLSLQGTTIGSFGLRIPFMCNGANLAYKKEAFQKVQGFSGNDTIASGDDVFLLEKFIQKWPRKVSYLKSKNALVTTYSVTTWKEFTLQRIRWASKSTNYNLLTGKIIGVLVILMNALFCTLPLFLLTLISWKFLLGVFITKIIIDSLLLVQTLRFTQQKIKFASMIISGIIYPYITILIFLISLFSSYTWKNRRFKK